MPETVRNNKKSHGRGKKILLLALSVPAFILLTEVILVIIPIDTYFENRFFLVNRALDYPEVFKKDPQLFWRLRSSQTISSKFFEGKKYSINSHGLRGEEIPAGTGKVRIVVMGNSCTFGWGIPNDKTYAEQLGRLINADGALPEVEVINAGIPGYSTFQGRRFFYTDIILLKPDIVMMMFAWNDQWAAADNIPDKNQQMPPEYIINLQNIFSRLKIYRLIKKIALSIIEEPLDSKLIKENPVYRVSEGDFYDNLDVIIQYCKREKITPVLLTSPIPSLEKYYPPGVRSPMHQYHEYYNYQTRQLAKFNKIPLVDVAKIFNDYDNLFDNAPEDPIHFNDAGHRTAAEAIFNYFKQNDTLLVVK